MRVVLAVRALGIFGRCERCTGVEKFVTMAHSLGGPYKGVKGGAKGMYSVVCMLVVALVVASV